VAGGAEQVEANQRGQQQADADQHDHHSLGHPSFFDHRHVLERQGQPAER